MKYTVMSNIKDDNYQYGIFLTKTLASIMAKAMKEFDPSCKYKVVEIPE